MSKAKAKVKVKAKATAKRNGEPVQALATGSKGHARGAQWSTVQIDRLMIAKSN